MTPYNVFFTTDKSTIYSITDYNKLIRITDYNKLPSNISNLYKSYLWYGDGTKTFLNNDISCLSNYKDNQIAFVQPKIEPLLYNEYDFSSEDIYQDFKYGDNPIYPYAFIKNRIITKNYINLGLTVYFYMRPVYDSTIPSEPESTTDTTTTESISGLKIAGIVISIVVFVILIIIIIFLVLVIVIIIIFKLAKKRNKIQYVDLDVD